MTHAEALEARDGSTRKIPGRACSGELEEEGGGSWRGLEWRVYRCRSCGSRVAVTRRRRRWHFLIGPGPGD